MWQKLSAFWQARQQRPEPVPEARSDLQGFFLRAVLPPVGPHLSKGATPPKTLPIAGEQASKREPVGNSSDSNHVRCPQGPALLSSFLIYTL